MSAPSGSGGGNSCKPKNLEGFQHLTDAIYSGITPKARRAADDSVAYISGCSGPHFVSVDVIQAIPALLARFQRLGNWTAAIGAAFAHADGGSVDNASISAFLRQHGFSDPTLGDHPTQIDWSSNAMTIEKQWAAKVAAAATGARDVTSLAGAIQATFTHLALGMKASDVAGATGTSADFLAGLGKVLGPVGGGIAGLDAAAGQSTPDQVVATAGGAAVTAASFYFGAGLGTFCGPLAEVCSPVFGTVLSTVSTLLYDRGVKNGEQANPVKTLTTNLQNDGSDQSISGSPAAQNAEGELSSNALTGNPAEYPYFNYQSGLGPYSTDGSSVGHLDPIEP